METKFRRDKVKHVMGETASKTVRFTVRLVKLIFVIVIIYTIVVSILVFISTGADFLINIATISVGGFWAFFLGYFGWRLGQSIEEYFVRMKIK